MAEIAEFPDWHCDRGCKSPDTWQCIPREKDQPAPISHCQCSCHSPRQRGSVKPAFKPPIRKKFVQ